MQYNNGNMKVALVGLFRPTTGIIGYFVYRTGPLYVVTPSFIGQLSGNVQLCIYGIEHLMAEGKPVVFVTIGYIYFQNHIC